MATAPQRIALSEPRIATLPPRTLVGINCRYTCETRSGIPDQWASFGPYIGKIPGQLNGMAYGVSHNGTPEGAFDYLCAVEVSGAAPLAEGFTSLRLEPLQVVVFRHRGRVHEITATIDAIFSQWIPNSGYVMGGPVNVIEQYSEDFDPRTNAGWIDIWVPVHR
jgi:AraC family transcriptional regulator